MFLVLNWNCNKSLKTHLYAKLNDLPLISNESKYLKNLVTFMAYVIEIGFNQQLRTETNVTDNIEFSRSTFTNHVQRSNCIMVLTMFSLNSVGKIEILNRIPSI